MDKNKSLGWHNGPAHNPGRKSSFIAPIVFLSVLTIVLAFAVGLLIKQSLKNMAQKERIVQEKEQLLVQRDMLLVELDTLEMAYNDLSARYAGFEKEFNIQKEEIARLRAQVVRGETRAALLDSEKKIMELNDQLESFQQQLAQLTTENDELSSENRQMRSALIDMATATEELEREKEQMSGQIRKAAVLSVFNVELLPLRETRRGETETSRARNVSKLRICFTIAENTLARKGEHRFYFRIIGPDKMVLAPQGIVNASVAGQQYETSFMETLNYQNREESFCANFSGAGKYAKGIYQVSIFSEDRELWDGIVELK